VTMGAPWTEWPKWHGERSFRTPRFNFSCSISEYSGKTDIDNIILLKNRNLIDLYKNSILNTPADFIFELGFFEGGMPLFLVDMIKPKKLSQLT
jgi:hypothetical protein